MSDYLPPIVTKLDGDISGLAAKLGEAEGLVDEYGKNVEKTTEEHGKAAGEAGGKGLTEKLEEELGKPTVAEKPLAGISKRVREKFKEIGEKSGGDLVEGVEQEVKTLETKLQTLADEMMRTGNFDLMKEFKSTQGDLGVLSRVRKEFEQVKAEAEKVGAEVAQALTPKGGGDKSGGGGGILNFALDEFVSNGVKKLSEMVQTGIPQGLNALSGAGASSGMTQYLIAAAVVASPAIGAAINAGVLLGVGGGGLAAGIIAVAHDDRVKGEWTGMFKGVAADFTAASGPLIGPLVHGADQLGAAFHSMMPDIASGMDKLGPVVDHLIQGAIDFLANIGPGWSAAFDASIPILDMVGNELLPRMGDALNQFFLAMAAGGPGAQMFFHDLINVIDLVVVSLGGTILALSKAYEWASRFGLTTAPILDWLAKLIPAGEGGKKGLDDVAQGADNASGKVDKVTKSLSDFISEAFRMQDSQLALQKGLFDVAAAFEKNGSSIDIHTEKGLANRQALQHQIETIARWRQEQLDAGKAPAFVNGEIDKQIRLMYDDAKAHGANVAQLDALIRQWRTILELPAYKSFQTDVITNRISNGGPAPGAGAAGGPRMQRYGGIVQHAAGGLITQPGIYQGQGDGSVVMAERETKREGYVPENISGPNAYGLLSEMAAWKGWSIDTGGGGSGGGYAGGGGAPSTGGGGDSRPIVLQLVVDSRVFYEQVVLPQQYQWLTNNGYVPGQSASGR